jgi:hypothetical protein
MNSVPAFLAHLPTHAGLPVPFTQAWIDSKPDFRAVDPSKVIRCVDEKLCAICGRRLGELCYFIGGPRSRDNHLFSDPAMHQQCAAFASRACPFLSGKTETYSDREIDATKMAVIAAVHAVRPEEMYILKCRTKKMRLVRMDDAAVIQAGSWLGQRAISSGV